MKDDEIEVLAGKLNAVVPDYPVWQIKSMLQMLQWGTKPIDTDAMRRGLIAYNEYATAEYRRAQQPLLLAAGQRGASRGGIP
jgi:hypothetical protein